MAVATKAKAQRGTGTIDRKELRATFKNFTPTQLLAISETLTALARQKIKRTHQAA